MTDPIPQSPVPVHVPRNTIGWTVWIATCLFAAVIGARGHVTEA